MVYKKKSTLIFIFIFVTTSICSADCPPLLSESYFFVTWSKGSETDKNPTYVSNSGGVVKTFEFSSCMVKNLTVNFLAAFFSQAKGPSSVVLNIYSKGYKIKSKSFQIDKHIIAWTDIRNKNAMKPYSDKITFPKDIEVTQIEIFVVPGNWATVIHDFEIVF
jgi:hypothetical protein